MPMNQFAAAKTALRRQSAIVTGSTSGIGLGIAKTLAAAGANVLLDGFDDRAAVERLRRGVSLATGVEVDDDGANLSKVDQLARMVEDAAAAFGQIDILGNNAGIQFVSPIESFPPRKWNPTIALNLSAASTPPARSSWA